MSEAGAKILRPSTSHLYAPIKHNVSPRTVSVPKQIAIIQQKAIYYSPREPQSLYQLSGYYSNMITCVKSFLFHNNLSGEFRGVFNLKLNDLDVSFRAFVQSNPSSVSDLTLRRSHVLNFDPEQFREKINPFLKHLATFIKYMRQIRESGNSPIHEAVDLHFQVIYDSLLQIQKSSTAPSGVHDPIIRRSKSLQSQLNNIKRNAVNVISQNIDPTKVSNEIRGFSRQLNSAFALEFSRSPLGPLAIERLRSSSYSACCSVIHSIRDASLFINDSIRMFSAYDEFLSYLEIYVEKGIGEKLSKILAQFSTYGEEEDIVERTIIFDPNMGLKEIIEKGKACFNEPPKLVEYFDALDKSATNVIDENECLTARCNEMDRVENESKQVKSEIERIQLENQRYIAEIENIKKKMDESSSKITEYSINAEKGEQYKRMVLDMIPIICAYLNCSKPDFDVEDDKLILEIFGDLIQSVFSRKCEKCLNFMNRETYINDLLSQIVDSDGDCVETVKKGLIEMKNAQAISKEKTSEISAQNFTISNLRGSFRKILGLFDSDCSSENVDIGDFTYEVVQKQLEIIKNNSQELIMQASNSQKELVQGILTKLRNLVGTEEIGDLDHYISVIEGKIHELEQLQIRHKLYINKVYDTLAPVFEDKKDHIIDEETTLLTCSSVVETVAMLKSDICALESQIREIEEKHKEEIDNMLIAQSPEPFDPATILGPISDKISEILDDDFKPDSLEDILVRIDTLKDLLVKARRASRASFGGERRATSTLTDIIKRLKRYYDEPEEIPQEFTKICDMAADLVMRVTRPTSQPSIKTGDILRLCENAVKVGGFTSTEDPYILLPELSDSYALLKSSVDNLKPFASTLNTIFMSFDSNFTCLDPNSPHFSKVRGFVTDMHSTLTSLNASKINNTVFLVLSRFVTLLSSFVSSISICG